MSSRTSDLYKKRMDAKRLPLRAACIHGRYETHWFEGGRCSGYRDIEPVEIRGKTRTWQEWLEETSGDPYGRSTKNPDR